MKPCWFHPVHHLLSQAQLVRVDTTAGKVTWSHWPLAGMQSLLCSLQPGNTEDTPRPCPRPPKTSPNLPPRAASHRMSPPTMGSFSQDPHPHLPPRAASHRTPPLTGPPPHTSHQGQLLTGPPPLTGPPTPPTKGSFSQDPPPTLLPRAASHRTPTSHRTPHTSHQG